MTKTFYLRTTWDEAGQQSNKLNVDDNTSIREAVGPFVPRDVHEWMVTDKGGQDVTNFMASQLDDQSVLFIAPAVPGG